MTVKSDQKEPNLNFLQLSNDLEKLTIRITDNEKYIPKRHRFTLGNRLVNLSMDIYENVRRANIIYPKTKTQYKMRLRYQYEAFSASEALLTHIGIAGELFTLNANRLEEWSRLAVDTKRTIRAWIKKDEERFKDL